jgi:hypothetical protein
MKICPLAAEPFYADSERGGHNETNNDVRNFANAPDSKRLYVALNFKNRASYI